MIQSNSSQFKLNYDDVRVHVNVDVHVYVHVHLHVHVRRYGRIYDHLHVHDPVHVQSANLKLIGLSPPLAPFRSVL